MKRSGYSTLLSYVTKLWTPTPGVSTPRSMMVRRVATMLGTVTVIFRNARFPPGWYPCRLCFRTSSTRRTYTGTFWPRACSESRWSSVRVNTATSSRLKPGGADT